ncbi:MAG: SDR family NAD(P)-dependent oxidoreductase [Planctomycetota bacterium]|nr:SDR family NAD(P)-dependent oxidoreductase [Planctomycetota bacterium]
MRACVTGGAGFIGSHLVERLAGDGWSVCVLDDLSSGRAENVAAAPGAELIVGDVRDPAAIRSAAKGADVVFHLAALASVQRSLEHPHEVIDVNMGGTLAVLEAARAQGVRRVVLASSSSIYGDTPTLPKCERMPIAPRSPYAASKAGAEALMHAYRRTFGLETAILRFFNVYGPRQPHGSRYAGAIPIFLSACLDDRPCTLYGDGEQTRDFTYVEDVVDAVVRAASAEGTAVAEPINIGAGQRHPLRELLALIERVGGRPLRLTRAPARAGDVRDSEADAGRARSVLGWQPTIGLERGLERTAAALRCGDQAVGPSS